MISCIFPQRAVDLAPHNMSKVGFLNPVIYIFLLLLFLTSVIPARASSEDPFARYLTDRPPVIVRVAPTEVTRGVRVERVIFHSRVTRLSGQNESSEVFAVIARPNGSKHYPGLLLLHGGSGSAETEKAITWAGMGYVVVAPDLPGIAAPDKIPFSNGAWKMKTANDYISASPDATASPIFDAVLVGVQSFYLLRSQPNIIKERIGVVGYAWGGYVATMVSGLTEDKMTAAFSVFGTGFYDAGSYWKEKLDRLPVEERKEWLQFMDAGRRAPLIKANYFLATSTHHPYFWLPAARATINTIKSPKNQVFAPNSTTAIPLRGGTAHPGLTSPTWTEMEKSFFAYQLKGIGKPFPVVKILSESRFEKDIVRVSFRIEGTVTNVEAYYSLPVEPSNVSKWQNAVVAKINDGLYQAIIPIEVATAGADWFALASSSHPATVSSEIKEVPRPK